MINMNKALLLTAGILGSSLVMAANVHIDLTSHKVNGGFKTNIGKVAASIGGMFDKKNDTSFVYLGLGVEDSDPDGPLAIGLGARLYTIDTNRNSGANTVAAVGVGGWYRYTIPKANRLSIYASLYYSPEILTLSNTDHMYEYEIRTEYKAIKNARVYIRYGKMSVSFPDDSTKDLNKGFSIGATLDF